MISKRRYETLSVTLSPDEAADAMLKGLETLGYFAQDQYPSDDVQDMYYTHSRSEFRVIIQTEVDCDQ